MRKILIPLLLASAATSPAFAQSYPRHGSGDRAERQSERADRAERMERADRASDRSDRSIDRSDRNGPSNDRRPMADRGPQDRPSMETAQPSAERVQRIEDARRNWQDSNRGGERPSTVVDRRNEDRGRPVLSREDRNARADVLREQRADQARHQFERIREARRNQPPPVVSTTPRPNTQPPEAHRDRHDSPRWTSRWRDDHRYDWKRYRRHNGWRFHLGFYSDPFGWGYQPYQVGWRMWPSFYSHNYWLSDPWQYRLPYAPPGTRWIRYWNDAILVDTWNGQVLDVIRDFFW